MASRRRNQLSGSCQRAKDVPAPGRRFDQPRGVLSWALHHEAGPAGQPLASSRFPVLRCPPWDPVNVEPGPFTSAHPGFHSAHELSATPAPVRLPFPLRKKSLSLSSQQRARSPGDLCAVRRPPSRKQLIRPELGLTLAREAQRSPACVVSPQYQHLAYRSNVAHLDPVKVDPRGQVSRVEEHVVEAWNLFLVQDDRDAPAERVEDLQ